MRFSSVIGVFSLVSFSTSAVASAVLPRVAEAGAAALAKRAPIDDVYSICENLYTEIQTYTGSISIFFILE